MYEQKSNLGSILVALLAIALILGGVFLLNQSFNNTKNKDLSNLPNSSNNSLLVIKNNSSSGLIGLDSESLSISSENSTLSNNSSVSNFSSFSSLGRSTNSSSQDSSNSSSSEKNTTLKVGEFTAKAITPTAKGSNWEIIECNVTTVYFCKTGFKFPFSQSGKLDKTYKFSGGSIADTKAGLAVSGVNPALID